MFLPKVSILIPCYNAERWIEQCIQSALSQTYPHQEVIVVDDGSTDSSLEIIKSFGHRISWETQSNKGSNIARNRLLEVSTGEWLQYLDADDYLLPNKIEAQLEVLEKASDADVICSPVIAEYHEGEKIWKGSSAKLYPRDPWILLARWALPQTGGSLWRKKALVDVGGWKNNQPCCQEHELYFRLLINNKKFIYLDDSNAVYRLWSNTTISRKNQRDVYYHRLLIKEQLEQHLPNNDFTKQRLFEINQARFKCARSIYQFDKSWSQQIVYQVRKSDPSFVPKNTSLFEIYTLAYWLGGFVVAENLARYRQILMKFLYSHLK